MKKTLVREIQKIQSYCTFLFIIFASGLIMTVLLNYTFGVNCERLQTITNQIVGSIHQNPDIFDEIPPNVERIQSALSPLVHRIIQSHPEHMIAGLYLKELDRIVVMASKSNDEFHFGNRLSDDESRRCVWKIRESAFTLYYSRMCRSWMLKCEQPVMVNNVLIGYSFTSMFMADFIKTNVQLGLIVVVLLSLLGTIIFLLSNRIKLKISRNLDRLVLNGSNIDTQLDYVEFQQVAKFKENTLKSLKMTEGYLREAHRKINTILDSINDGFLILDSDWRITYANQNAIDFLPFRLNSSLVGRTIWELLPDLRSGLLYDNLSKAFHDQTQLSFEMGSDINRKWFHFYVYPNGNSLTIIIREITERVLIKRTLERTEQQILDIIERITDGFYALDHNFRYLYMNESGSSLLGFKREELIQRRIWDVFPELEGTYLYEQYHKTLHEQVPVIFESHFGNDERWFENRVYPSKEGIIVFFSDITKRKEAELMIAAERELLATVLASVEEGVIATDLHGKVLMISRRAEKLTGWTADEVERKSLVEWFYVMDDQSSESYDYLINDSLSSRQPVTIENAVLVTKTLTEIQIRLYCAPLINPMDQQLMGSVIVFEDITQKKLLQETLLKTEKYESLAILAGGIAHDFNNYLAAILSNIQLAKLLMTKGKTVDRHLDQVIDVSLKASELTRQLLTFSKGGAPVKRLGSIAQLVEDIVNFNLRGSKVKCVFSIAKNLWNAEFDPGQISQVITNLTLNAKQAMADGGILKVSAKNVVITDNLLYKPGNYVKLVFKDQGIGIPEDIVDKVFDPFFTTKPEGSGLGLALTYSIIRKHDGYIEVDSIPGQGCKFTVYLPASHTQLERETNTYEMQSAPIIHGHVLLMDDEEMIRNVMAESLRHLGYTVVTTKDGAETVACYCQALEENEPFDIVILDLTIPGGMGGLETIAQLLKIDPYVKAVISSGYATDPVIAGYREFGFAAFVSKPYKLDELSEVLQKLLRDIEQQKDEVS